jgi:signal recognition particle receptor subunit beta
MAFVNYTTKSIAIKVVYYGPGLSGKTTNLRYIYSKLDDGSRGDLLCLETPIERTLFFDLLPIKAGMIHDFQIHFQLMTVPGQVFYGASRKSVLKGADGIVFVADSQIPLLDANLENFDGLRKNLLEFNVDLNFIPLIFQYNKRDLDNLIPVETFNSLLNPLKLPYVEASAVNGVGVFETLKEIAKLTIPYVREKVFGDKKEPKPGLNAAPPPVGPAMPAEPAPMNTEPPKDAAPEEPEGQEAPVPEEREASGEPEPAVPEAPEPSAPETPVEPQPELQMAPEEPGPAAPEHREEPAKVKDDLEFETEETGAPVRLTKIKFSNQSDIEKEVEKLAQEFGGKS